MHRRKVMCLQQSALAGRPKLKVEAAWRRKQHGSRKQALGWRRPQLNSQSEPLLSQGQIAVRLIAEN